MPHLRTSTSVLPPLVGGVLLACTLAAPLAAQESGPDTEPPLIEIETVTETRADRSQVFTAQVVDDRALEDVLLYHRREGQLPYTSTAMRPLGDSAYFSATVRTDPADLRPIEYYVQARDRGGNRSVSGFAFEPFRRTLQAASPPLSTGAGGPSGVRSGAVGRAADDDEAGGRPRWWAIALGVVTVGALAALAGGSGGGDDGDRARLVIDLEEPRGR